MSQSESLKDSVSAWPINMPEVSKRTRGNGRNGTEQRALEGMQHNSEQRGKTFPLTLFCLAEVVDFFHILYNHRVQLYFDGILRCRPGQSRA